MTSPEQMVFYDQVPDFQQAESSLTGMYTEAFRRSLCEQPRDLFTFPRPWSRVDLQITDLICRTYLREDGVAHADRLSMANSVEIRLPLLDHRLVETVIGLRKTRRDDCESPKFWLRSAARDMLPSWVINRKKKGFQPPLGQWYAQLFQQFGDVLHDGFLVQAGILTSRAAKRLSRGECPPRIVHPLSFRALVLEMWCRNITELQNASISTRAA